VFLVTVGEVHAPDDRACADSCCCCYCGCCGKQQGCLTQRQPLAAGGQQRKAISNLAPATFLRELSVAPSAVECPQGLEKLVALETLDVTNTDIRTEDLSILRQCSRLVTLTANGDITALESIIHAAPSSLAACTSVMR
jgi:hypothetical protein